MRQHHSRFSNSCASPPLLCDCRHRQPQRASDSAAHPTHCNALQHTAAHTSTHCRSRRYARRHTHTGTTTHTDIQTHSAAATHSGTLPPHTAAYSDTHTTQKNPPHPHNPPTLTYTAQSTSQRQHDIAHPPIITISVERRYTAPTHSLSAHTIQQWHATAVTCTIRGPA
jgi:hypothetical protein